LSEAKLAELAADIISGYVAANKVDAAALPDLIKTTYAALKSISETGAVASAPEKLPPAVAVKKSITHEFLVCLDCGKKQKSLKRHLQTAHELAPEDYRAKWGLEKGYPMVAPAYAQARSDLAKQMGLGQGGRAKAKAPAKSPRKSKS
jgi:predicted transcriptional regulator